ncbi:MAG: 8-amino-7-oxononanoate synthase [Microcystis aeruginosa BK11-02]|nr:8-amino-7-oxononanoate synthase [Microcystis aeruginosa BK11-02]NCS79893.1 8-amino-7-oxononanoate synthase [Microcystis aeruginosa K13-07]
MNHPYSWIEDSLKTLHRANWYRRVKTIQGRGGAVIELEGRSLLNFASNDYLGLAADERMIAAAIAATQRYGTGSTGSRLLTGHRDIHRDLELAIASFKNSEDAIVFSSGYLANLGTITCLVGQKDLILGDQYNHSSLKNGAKLSGATVKEYRHNSLEDLENQLLTHRHHYRHCLLLTDTVFSMDGDICPLAGILALAEMYNCMVLVDEAHATGVMGENGTGCVEYCGCQGRELIQMGTLSKALGSLGGYVTGSAKIIDFIRNRAATWIYTTGLSPADTAAARMALEIIRLEPERRQRLHQNINFVKSKLNNFNILPSEAAILCLLVANPGQALELSQKLLEKGIFAPAIRPPTVPTSRLRFTAMATHSLAHLEILVQSIGESFPT